ncbi:hypothetical protein ANCDUO_08841 [Ancylostoma duodenale]|uniref:Uncharacterized protein n=1 Tax=Ancylostoma duodenale TaxID=51022 RepID=A0A0C2GPC5_9BILA|nr:hypothetical protein ANCDUO_08841 [Ancylostoma duodenale]
MQLAKCRTPATTTKFICCFLLVVFFTQRSSASYPTAGIEVTEVLNFKDPQLYHNFASSSEEPIAIAAEPISHVPVPFVPAVAPAVHVEPEPLVEAAPVVAPAPVVATATYAAPAIVAAPPPPVVVAQPQPIVAPAPVPVPVPYPVRPVTPPPRLWFLGITMPSAT